MCNELIVGCGFYRRQVLVQAAQEVQENFALGDCQNRQQDALARHRYLSNLGMNRTTGGGQRSDSRSPVMWIECNFDESSYLHGLEAAAH